MKKLFLLRHAKSDHPADMEDHERPLNARGKESCRMVGNYLKQQQITFDKALCSDAIRTRQTFELVSATMGHTIICDYSAKLYLATPREMIEAMLKVDDTVSSLLVVAHNPGIHQTCALLLGGGESQAVARIATGFPTAGLAQFRLDMESWQDLAPRKAYLEQFITPKDNRA